MVSTIFGFECKRGLVLIKKVLPATMIKIARAKISIKCNVFSSMKCYKIMVLDPLRDHFFVFCNAV